MRCCLCNAEFHPKWDNEKKAFERDCTKCVSSYKKKPPNKFAISSDEHEDTGYDLLDKLSDELGLQDNENITLKDVVRVERGTDNGYSESEEDESTVGSPNWD